MRRASSCPRLSGHVPEPGSELPAGLGDALDRRLATAQAEERLPSVGAAVFRDGAVVWERSLGLASVDTGEEATGAHQYRIGSITKTFTAVAILQLRDAGHLELDAPVRSLLPEFPPGPTFRQALSHLSGLQREPPGEIWETMTPPDREALVAGLEDAERVARPGRAWHYSNLVFGLLGEVVARATGSYETTLRERILDPLGLERTRLRPDGPRATPYFVDPWSDAVRLEPDPDAAESAAAIGWLWSTPSDLARWGDFLATGHEDVLSRATLDEMARVHTMVDEAAWTVGWGLGLGLQRRGERVFAGHGGAMPGFLASLVVHRPERTGAVVLTNTGAGASPDVVALDLADAALAAFTRVPEPWRPDAGAPADVASLLGTWWTEGTQLLVTWSGGRLRIELVGGPAGRSVSWLEREADDRWRVGEGRELGEVLRIARGEGGAVTKLYFATYPVTRNPSTFGA